MTPFERPDRCCPECGHTGYVFRARKNVAVPEGKFVEARYRCRSCSVSGGNASRNRRNRSGRTPATRHDAEWVISLLRENPSSGTLATWPSMFGAPHPIRQTHFFSGRFGTSFGL
jgi:hypothetical protein